METAEKSVRRVPGYCPLCVSRCGSIAIVENGRFTALEPDPSHPTGRALCIKGKVAPELVYHSERLRHPLKRTRPKGEADPGWQKITWDEALETTASQLKLIAREHGPETVVFATASPSTAATSDVIDWIDRLRRAYGSPNLVTSMELCGWGRYLATTYSFGAGVPGNYMPDVANAGCILYWGYNPSVSRIAHSTSTNAAVARGAKLIVVDPRNVGVARRADEWLRVRPGTDGALALAIAGAMIERGYYDRAFVRDWTNGPLLVRSDTGRLLTEADLTASGEAGKYVGWDETALRPLVYDPRTGQFEAHDTEPALFGEFKVAGVSGTIPCHTVFQLTRDLCARYAVRDIESICGVPLEQVERTAALLWQSRPVAYYAWSGVEQHTNSTQTARAIGLLYTLTGNLDEPGGNVLFPAVPSNNISGYDLLSPEQRRKSLGMKRFPLGPARWEHASAGDLYRAALEGDPYRARGLVVFGANLLMSNADSRRGRDALSALEFHVHADLFMNPTAEQADIVLPVASAFEREGLRIGFDIDEDAQSLVQLRPPVVPPQGESRSDCEIIFDLACRIGLGAHFWDGDIDAANRHRLEPSGLSLDALRARPGGIRVPLNTRHRKFVEVSDGVPRGFNTPSRRVELFSQALLDGGFAALPEFVEPAVSRAAKPELGEKYPLVLTCTKGTMFCETQHRGLPSLRKRVPDPEVELHPDTAAARGISAGDWVSIKTPNGSVRARAKLNDALDRDVVCGQHGWWQACVEIGAPGYDPFSEDGANYNLLVSLNETDPISGSAPLRSYVCEVTPIAGGLGA